MFTSLLITAVVVAMVECYPANLEDTPQAPAKYKFEYRVEAPEEGTSFSHQESSDDGVTQGGYDVALSDGRLQSVTYTADKTGYHALVEYKEAPVPLPLTALRSFTDNAPLPLSPRTPRQDQAAQAPQVLAQPQQSTVQSQQHHQNGVHQFNPTQQGFKQPQSSPVLLQPQTGPVVQPQSGPVFFQPQTGPVSFQPQTGPVSFQPQNGQVFLQPQTASLAQPQTGLVSFQPQTGPVSFQPPNDQVSFQPQTAPQFPSQPGLVSFQQQPQQQSQSTFQPVKPSVSRLSSSAF